MKRLFAFFFLSSSCFATELAPWFPPLWEFQGRASYFYNCDRRIQTPKGSFHAFQDNHSVDLGLNATIWPYWNVEVELGFTHTKKATFGYRAVFFTGRYQWLDDITGDPLAFTTGITFFFPGDRFLHDFSFPYHGPANAEIHGAFGKEFWQSRIWAYGGFGIANRGNPWIHAIASWEKLTLPCYEMGIYSEALFGLGDHDIFPESTFKGYRSIRHQNVDIGIYISRQIGVIGNASLGAWYTIYAKNFIENRFGVGVSFLVPFSL